MSKLHELLAVEGDLQKQADVTRKDLQTTFEKKKHHFSRKVVTIKSVEEGVPDKVESQLAMQTTVKKELTWIGEKLEKIIDAGFHIDLANQQAKADVELEDGTFLLKGVPVTQLLRLEHRLTEIRELALTIPMLDPAQGFKVDTSQGIGIYKADDDTRPKTEKKFDFIVMVGPTDKHPAQIKELMVDKIIAHSLTQEWSGLIHVSEKAAILDRIEGLIRAVKKARARANEMEVDVKTNKIGNTILDYVFGA